MGINYKNYNLRTAASLATCIQILCIINNFLYFNKGKIKGLQKKRSQQLLDLIADEIKEKYVFPRLNFDDLKRLEGRL